MIQVAFLKITDAICVLLSFPWIYYILYHSRAPIQSDHFNPTVELLYTFSFQITGSFKILLNWELVQNLSHHLFVLMDAVSQQESHSYWKILLIDFCPRPMFSGNKGSSVLFTNCDKGCGCIVYMWPYLYNESGNELFS